MQTHADAVYQFGQFEVNATSGELFRNGKRVKLQEQPFRLLVVLLENAGEVVTREELRSRIWPEDTFVDFDGSLRAAVRKLREALGDDAESPRYIETIPKRGYRFLGPAVRPAEDISPVAATTAVTAEGARTARIHSSLWILSSTVLLVVIGAAAVWLLLHRPRKALALTEKDTVVLADFVNSTGDPVFDGTLRQGLAVELEQSPFLSLISDQRIQQTLRLMGQPSDARLTSQIAHDICRRTQSAAYLTGSIASLGTQYILGLKALSCPTGDILAEEQETANGKEKILGALDNAAIKLREKLGESLNTVEKFDTPLEQATTPSLEALQAYTLGRKTQSGKDEFAAAIPLYRRAVELDPNFAIAHAALASSYRTVGETLLGEENARRAYDLRAPISEPERFYVESTYFHYVTGDLEKARQVYDLWAQTYPRNSSAPVRLWQLYTEEGQDESALAQIREAVRLDPWKGLIYPNLGLSLIHLDRLQEAGTTAKQAIVDGHDSSGLRRLLYRLAFLENDAPGMARQAEWVVGKPEAEAEVYEQRAQTAAYSGNLKESRNLSRQAIASAMRAQEREEATDFNANAALREALSGRVAEVHLLAKSALASPTGRGTLYATALSLAIAGDGTRAQSLAQDLARRYPEDTLVQFNFLPALRAQIALNGHNPAKAIELLQLAKPYELSGVWWGFLGPVYVRGEAYLMAQRGNEAAMEFQKILDHRGIVLNSPTGALAHLQLGRAYAMSGDKAKARSAYQDFLTLWKDADPDIPILKQAKAEYAKL